MANLPRVALIITGGTIDSVGKDRLDLAWYIEAGKRLKDGEILEMLPELKQIAEVTEIPFRRLPSHALVDKDWLDLVRTIHKIFDEDKADGIVITHGTNTIEETAYFLNLVLKTDKPVVVVGSMRPSSAISADGYLNLVNAIKVAADPNSKGRGCLLVMNDTIYNGRDVTKNATYRVEAFQSRDLGPHWVSPTATARSFFTTSRCASTQCKPSSTCAIWTPCRGWTSWFLTSAPTAR